MEAMVFICVIGILGLEWQVSRIRKTVDQILENQNAGDENQNADNAYSTCRARARKHLGRGQLSEAVLDLTEAIRLKPDHAEAYNQRGLVYRRLEQYAEAIEDYTEAIRLANDEIPDPYFKRGQAYNGKGWLGHALRDYNQAIARDGSRGEFFWLRGELWESKREYAKARDDFETAQRLGYRADEEG